MRCGRFVGFKMRLRVELSFAFLFEDDPLVDVFAFSLFTFSTSPDLLLSDLLLDLLDFFDDSTFPCFDFLLLFDERLELLDEDLLTFESPSELLDFLLLSPLDFEELDFLSSVEAIGTTSSSCAELCVICSGKNSVGFSILISISLVRSGGRLLIKSIVLKPSLMRTPSPNELPAAMDLESSMLSECFSLDDAAELSMQCAGLIYGAFVLLKRSSL